MDAVKKTLKKIKPKILIVMLLDFLSFSMLFLLTGIFRNMVLAKLDSVILPESIFQLSENELMELSSAVQGYYYYFISLVIGFVILVILLWSVSRAIVWKASLEKKVSVKYLLKSMLLGYIWFVPSLLIAALMLLTLKQEFSIYLFLVYSVIQLYLSIIVFMKYSIKEKINVFGESFSEAARNYRVLISFAAMLIIYYILSQALNIVVSYAQTAGIILSIIIYLFYFACSRYYIIELCKKRG